METPEDVQGRLNGCHLALDDLEKALDPLLSASQQEVETQVSLLALVMYLTREHARRSTLRCTVARKKCPG